ncbi:hypothetical protein ABZP36_009659 [Zizania latifolia]
MPKKSKRNRPGAVELVADHVVCEEGKPISEAYGFVGSITTIIAMAIYLIWAYTPERCLHSVSITYYPSRYSFSPMTPWFQITDDPDLDSRSNQMHESELVVASLPEP